MRDLIARLESATGPDRKLDDAILETVGLVWREDFFVWSQTGARYRGQVNFTASLDAALALVPNGMAWSVTDRRAEGYGSPGSYASVWRMNQLVGRQCPHELPIIALCIAALRARLTMETPDADPR